MSLERVGLLAGVVTSAKSEAPWTRWFVHGGANEYANTTDVSSYQVGEHLPEERPLQSLLCGAAIQMIESTSPDLVVGWYMEPFGLAAAHAAQVTGVKLVLAHAGSDLVRLARNPLLHRVYGEALGSADAVITTTRMAPILECFGVSPHHRLIPTGTYRRSFESDRHADLTIGGLDERAAWLGRIDSAECRAVIDSHWSWPLPQPDADLTVLVVGKASAPKRLRDVVKAISLLQEPSGRRLHLNLVTGGAMAHVEDVAEVARFADTAQVGLAVHPFVPQPALVDLFASHDAVVVLERGHDVASHSSQLPWEVLRSGGLLIAGDEFKQRRGLSGVLEDGKTCLLVDGQQATAPAVASTLQRLADLPLQNRIEIRARGQNLVRSLEAMAPPYSAFEALRTWWEAVA